MTRPTLVLSPQKQSSLPPADRKLLAELEARVESSVMEFCVALAQIRDHKNGIFWREQYESFPEYVRIRFGYSEQHAGRLAAAGGFLLHLEDKKSTAPRPISESQVRPLLNKLEPEHQISCWEHITENKAPAELTRDVIEAEVAQYQKSLPKSERKQERAKPKKKTDNKQAARERSHELVAKLRTATATLPQARDILKLLDQLDSVLDQEK